MAQFPIKEAAMAALKKGDLNSCVGVSRRLLRACILTMATFICAAAALAQSESAQSTGLPALKTVFSLERSEKEDVIHFRNNDVLRGKVLNETITVMTPYGQCAVPLRKCAGLSFEGARANTEAVVTVNHNRLTGIVNDRVIKFQIGTSGAPLEIRKEKIRFVLLKREKDETAFADPKAKTNLFVMTNGDLLVGQSDPNKMKIKTDYGEIHVGFDEMKTVEMQGGGNVTAVIKKRNGDTMRGTLETEELSLKLSLGVTIDAIYKDKFSKVFVGDGQSQALANFGLAQPVLGESDGAAFVPGVEGEVVTNTIGITLRLINPDKFMMGSPANEKDRDDDETQHEVVLTKPFYLGTHEVTQEQFEKIMGMNPSHFKGAKRPVESVTWNEAVEFCKKLSAKEPNLTYRLPTEAEWEYACRAGTTTRFYWGEDLDYSLIGQYTFFKGNSGNQTNEVGQKKPNAWGLYDMSGNVYEWCGDWFGDYPTGRATDPTGAPGGSYRVRRGGSWYCGPQHCRSAGRNYGTPDVRINFLGFRVLAVPAAGR